jgi:hypothetical protein
MAVLAIITTRIIRILMMDVTDALVSIGHGRNAATAGI